MQTSTAFDWKLRTNADQSEYASEGACQMLSIDVPAFPVLCTHYST